MCIRDRKEEYFDLITSSRWKSWLMYSIPCTDGRVYSKAFPLGMASARYLLMCAQQAVRLASDVYKRQHRFRSCHAYQAPSTASLSFRSRLFPTAVPVSYTHLSIHFPSASSNSTAASFGANPSENIFCTVGIRPSVSNIGAKYN